MNLFSVDPEKCDKDGICIKACPFAILERSAEGVPQLVTGGEKACIRCGHCLAVCPSGAITLDGVPSESRPPADEEGLPSDEAFARLVRNRRSIRVYRKKAVPREIVDRLLDTVRWAPTAKNVQPVHWLVTDDPEKIHEFAGLTVDYLNQAKMFPEINAAWERGKDMILRDAPLLVAAHAAENALNPPVDCTIAVTTLELAAMTYGLGACWAGFFMRAANDHPKLKSMLDLPAGHRLYGALMIGYPKFSYRRIPERRPVNVRWL